MIREMSSEECRRILARTRFARLACVHENQPYIVPVSLAYHEAFAGESCLYGFTTPGQKLEWMRANPLVCVEMDEVAACDRWVSVIAFGRFEELPETPGIDDERRRARERPRHAAGRTSPEALACVDERFRAYQLLAAQSQWWEPGASAWIARADRDPDEPYHPVYYKIRIDRVTGHESTGDARPRAATPAARGWRHWLRSVPARLFGGRSG